MCDHLNTKLSTVKAHGREDPVSFLEDLDMDEAAIVVDSMRLMLYYTFSGTKDIGDFSQKCNKCYDIKLIPRITSVQYCEGCSVLQY